MEMNPSSNLRRIFFDETIIEASVMKPARHFPTTVHVISVAILASGFIANMLQLSALDSMASFDGIDAIAEAVVSVTDADVALEVLGNS
jgi:hypothetical protein